MTAVSEPEAYECATSHLTGIPVLDLADPVFLEGARREL